jgi:hypothetical protein
MKPSVAVVNLCPVVTWIASDFANCGDGGEAMVRTRSQSGTWGTITSHVSEDDISCVSITGTVNNNQYAYGWAHTGGSAIQYVLSTAPNQIGLLAASGKSFQLSGGAKSISDFDEGVYAVSENNSYGHTSAPFTFNTQQLGSMVQKSSVASITGRKETVAYKNAEYSASLNDLTLDGGKIEFTDQPDSLKAASKDSLGVYILSEAFIPSKGQALSFNIRYAVSDSLKAVKDLKDGGQIKFRYDLVDAQSGMLIDRLLEIGQSSQLLRTKGNENYTLAFPDMKGKSVKIRFSAENVPGAQYAFTKLFLTKESLQKSIKKELELSSNAVIKDYRLEQNYPNPFNPVTTIRYQIPSPEKVTLKVYNLLGQQVSELVNGYQDAGSYEVKFDASKLSSGIYVYSLQAGKRQFSKKLTLIK